MRTGIAALFSQNGGFGITAGVEWYATEKIDVHQLNSLNWGAEENQIDFIKNLNEILTTQPAFFADAKLRMIQHGNHNGIVLLRQTENEDDVVLIVIENNGDLSGVNTKPGEILCLVSRLSGLHKDPSEFVSEIMDLPVPLCITKWNYPQDLMREAVVPASHFLFLQSEFPFNVKIFTGEKVLRSENSLFAETNFVLLTPNTFSESKEYNLQFTFYLPNKTEHCESKILILFPNNKLELKSCYSKKDVLKKNACVDCLQ